MRSPNQKRRRKQRLRQQAAAATEDGEAVVQTQGEKVSELYQADVVKYLIIPADSTAELPAGIEKGNDSRASADRVSICIG